MFRVLHDNALLSETKTEKQLKEFCTQHNNYTDVVEVYQFVKNLGWTPLYKGTMGSLNGQMNVAKFYGQSYVEWKREYDEKRRPNTGD